MRLLTALVFALGLLFIGGCGDDEIFRPNTGNDDSQESKDLSADLAALAKGAKPNDPEASVAYDNAVHNLIARGAKVESRMIDTLRSSPDPAVRLGCVEVLGAIASKLAIDHLIAVLDDEVPLVALKSDIALRTLTGARMIPEDGKPPKDGLPPVPLRANDNLALDAEEKLWSQWHQQHRTELKAAWERWWTANKATFTFPQ